MQHAFPGASPQTLESFEYMRRSVTGILPVAGVLPATGNHRGKRVAFPSNKIKEGRLSFIRRRIKDGDPCATSWRYAPRVLVVYTRSRMLLVYLRMVGFLSKPTPFDEIRLSRPNTCRNSGYRGYHFWQIQGAVTQTAP
jgi:hypothetical protein